MASFSSRHRPSANASPTALREPEPNRGQRGLIHPSPDLIPRPTSDVSRSARAGGRQGGTTYQRCINPASTGSCRPVRQVLIRPASPQLTGTRQHDAARDNTDRHRPQPALGAGGRGFESRHPDQCDVEARTVRIDRSAAARQLLLARNRPTASPSRHQTWTTHCRGARRSCGGLVRASGRRRVPGQSISRNSQGGLVASCSLRRGPPLSGREVAAGMVIRDRPAASASRVARRGTGGGVRC